MNAIRKMWKEALVITGTAAAVVTSGAAIADATTLQFTIQDGDGYCRAADGLSMPYCGEVNGSFIVNTDGFDVTPYSWGNRYTPSAPLATTDLYGTMTITDGASVQNYPINPGDAGHVQFDLGASGFFTSYVYSGGAPYAADSLVISLPSSEQSYFDGALDIASLSFTQVMGSGSYLGFFANNELGSSYLPNGWSNLVRVYGATVSCQAVPEQAPVPEPATMLLFGTGLAGLAALRRRRSAKTAAPV